MAAERTMLSVCVGVWLPRNLAWTLLDLKKSQLCTSILKYSRITYNNMADARSGDAEGHQCDLLSGTEVMI